MKWEDLKQLPEAQLKTEMEKLIEEMKNLRFQRVVNPLENPQLLRSSRRKIARIRTILRERAAANPAEKRSA